MVYLPKLFGGNVVGAVAELGATCADETYFVPFVAGVAPHNLMRVGGFAALFRHLYPSLGYLRDHAFHDHLEVTHILLTI